MRPTLSTRVMTEVQKAKEALNEVAGKIEAFHAKASVKSTGAGSRGEGKDFEALLLEFWKAVSAVAVAQGAVLDPKPVRQDKGSSKKRWCRLTCGSRVLYVPAPPHVSHGPKANLKPWLETSFKVEDLAKIEDGGAEAGLYEGIKTVFDDTLLRVEAGEAGERLVEKFLMEYKTGKSSKEGDKAKLDGNAHERFAFQLQQYELIAHPNFKYLPDGQDEPLKYQKCSLWLVSNGAFSTFPNKYEWGIRMAIARMGESRPHFSASYASKQDDYVAAAMAHVRWLLAGCEAAADGGAEREQPEGDGV